MYEVITRWVAHVECYNVVSACQHCCHENATILSLRIVLYLAVAVECYYGHATTDILCTSVELQNISYCYKPYKNITLQQATKAQRRSRGIALLFL
jgi:hypothetical protein